MKRRRLLGVGVLGLAALAAVPFPIAAQIVGTTTDEAPARVIVKLKERSPLLSGGAPAGTTARVERARVLGERLGFAMRAGAEVSERTQVVIAPGITSAELAHRLSRDDDVEYAVPDVRRRRMAAPNDPLYAAGIGDNGPAVGQWYLRATSGVVQSSLDVETAWNITRGSPGIAVAVLDTGVRYDHPDLLSTAVGGNLLPGYDMISDTDRANDGNGRDADASDPGDWVSAAEANDSRGPFYGCTELDPGTGRYVAEDSSWHGTKISGLIAARTDNGTGMASVGRNVRVLPVRVLGKCGGYDSDILAGMRWATGLSVAGAPTNPTRARIINLSLGGDGPCTAAYRDAVGEINAAGTLIVAAAGNSTGHAVGTPANCEGVLAVAALRHVGTKAGFSDLGLEIAISAPGGNCANTDLGLPCLYPILTTVNTGATNPASSGYSDSFNSTVGTSYSVPLVAGTAALMFSAQPAMTPLQARLLMQAAARPFPTTGGDNGDGTPVASCTPPQYDAFGNPVEQLQCYCTIDTCGAGMLDAGAAVRAAAAGVPAGGIGVEGLWWNAPGDSESGWGLNLAQQGTSIFATWFTYAATGKAWWLSMTATRIGTDPDTYSGELIESRGPAFSDAPFDAKRVTRNIVGRGTLTFADLNRGTFRYVVNGVDQTKTLTRQVFGPLPTCTYTANPDFAQAGNFQDLWWAGDAESGWGVNLTHQGDHIFATWFTYDLDGTPLWLSVTAAKTGPGVYGGNLIRTTGPAFDAVPFAPAAVSRAYVGTATFSFATGNAAMFSYTVNGVSQTKAITRELFAPPAGTLCH